jgi:hypothetical protein
MQIFEKGWSKVLQSVKKVTEYLNNNKNDL